MIYLYSGTPGSGKSLYATYEILRLLKAKKGVIANFPINLGYFRKKKDKMKFTYKSNDELSPEFLVSYAKENHKLNKENQTYIFIDEASILFNSREWDKKNRPAWVQFFQLHRKLGFNVVFICQQDRMLDRQIRAFIETEYKFRSIKNYKTFGFLLSLFSGGLFVKVEYWYPVRLRCGSQMFRYDKVRARAYDSYMIFQEGQGAFMPPGVSS